MYGINGLAAQLTGAALPIELSADLLQAQISIGDMLAATVLPPQNGQDLIQILGRQVAAQLPPGVYPGEVLLLRVTGISSTQIFVQNLGPYDPQNPPEALLQSSNSAAESEPEPAAASTVVPVPTASPAAPPSAVFVAASVRPASPAPESPLAAQAVASAVQRAAVAATNVEARIAAAQAAKSPATLQPPSTAAPRPPVNFLSTPVAARSLVVQSAVQNAVQNAASAVQRVIRSAGDLLEALRLPDTPLTRTASAIAPEAPARLPEVLARLEAALPRDSSDPRIATLRTLAAFVARISPQNEETLAAQIASYVSNAVQGSEPKLAQLLQSAASSDVPVASDLATADAQHGSTASPQAAHSASQPLAQSAAQGRVAERSAAIDHDLKSVVLSLLRNPPDVRSATLTQALNETLITLTGNQLNALSNNLNDPSSVTIALPVFFREGGKPAQIRISRDSNGRAAKMDADNFHIAFVLDTANLGTVAIDLQTTGRAVKVDVKTEQSSAVPRFSDTLQTLRSRLEDLRYRVLSAAAGVASRKPAQAPAQPKLAAKPNTSGVDMRA